jgi:carbamoyltransferase
VKQLKAMKPAAALDALASADSSGPDLVIQFPTHDKDLFDTWCGAEGALLELTEAINQAAERFVPIVLLHPVSPRTMQALPDLIRWVDDTIPSIRGIRFAAKPGLWEGQAMDALRPWFQSAIEVCVRREVGFEILDNIGWPQETRQGLNPSFKAEPLEVEPESVGLHEVSPDGSDIAEALSTMVERFGGFARFVHPAKLDLPAEMIAKHRAAEPRDDARFSRDVGPNPRVLINLGSCASEDELPHPALIRAVVDQCIALDTRPFIALRGDSSPIKALADELGVQILENPELNSLELDFAIALARVRTGPYYGAVRAGFALGDADHQAQCVDEMTKRWLAQDEEAHRRPLSAWHSRNRMELWILDAPQLDLILAGSDPMPIDRLCLDALGLEPDAEPILDAANQAGVSWAQHQGMRLHGEVAIEKIMGPARLPTRRGRVPGKDLVVLGVASTTLQNHAAAVVMDGEVVAAVQEERFRRRKQLGWHPKGRPFDTVVSDPRIPLERPYPSRSIQSVLDTAGITMDDVDCIALNGVPVHFFPTYSLSDPERPPQTVKFGRHMFIPHHLTHAASAYRVSGLDDSFIFTVDGRGERETAAFFETRDGRIHRIFDVLCQEDSLIGGVYEYFTTILGFGHHGQGSTMGLACMGEPSMDLSAFLSARSRSDYSIHDRGIVEAYGHLIRDRDGPLEQAHKDLAMSLQIALEETVIRLIEDGLDGRQCDNLCLAGGVTLNCRMNERIRQHFNVKNIFVQPAAHDAGTALGAAMEAHFEITGEAVPTQMVTANLGPGYSNERVEAALNQAGLSFKRQDDMPRTVAELLASDQIVCWFQDRLEYGPRALGARSLLADPRSTTAKDRMNVMKRRQWWRPLAPSMLHGHESEYFESDFANPFMLFTLPVLEHMREKIPAVLHFDGTTRPQSVTPEGNPRYHAMIEHFFSLTGIPMVMNTSFNTAFEPIVNDPEDAIASFLQLGADYLAIGDYLVSRAEIPVLR